MEAGTKTIVDEVNGDSGKAVSVLRFSGDISSSSRDAVLGAYGKVAKDRPVLLDFSRVDYINSSGIALVIQLMMEANKSGQTICAFGLTPHFQKVFTMVGITKYARLYPDEQTAKATV
ncbi:STAS domain-containing protein [Granulicella sp. L60]|uniref:STAS domain-containing protein n=1 Tax=Granulicella sp. L60 TaxID=1641866 RepID=UPI00131E6F92|nr:STAS domain-containing protein [Granulicella sp. L60]